MKAISTKNWNRQDAGAEFKGAFLKCDPIDISTTQTIANVLFGFTNSQADDLACAKWALERGNEYVAQMRRDAKVNGPKVTK